MNQSTIIHIENGATYSFTGVMSTDGRLEVQAAVFGNRVHLFHQRDIRGANASYFNNKDHRRLVGKARAKGHAAEVISWDNTELTIKKSGSNLDVRCMKDGADYSVRFITVLTGQADNIAQLAIASNLKEG